MDEARDSSPKDPEIGPTHFDLETDHVDIPDMERPPLSLESCGQGRFVHWNANAYVSDLKGRTFEEVKAEAMRIRPGEYFQSVKLFDRCLNSWGVLKGRSSSKYATKHTHAVRTCRFGPTVRKFSRTHIPNVSRGPMPQSANHQSIDEEPENEPPCIEHSDDQQWLYDPVDWSSGTLTVQENQENSTSHQPRLPLRLLQSTRNTLPRPPLAPLHINQLPNGLQVGPGHIGPPRTIVQHRSVWLPRHKPNETGKRISEAGACGQLSRFISVDVQALGNDHEPLPLCPFRVRLHREASTGRLKITECNLNHTCPQSKHKWRGPTQKSNWLGETLAPRVVRNVKVPVKELLKGFRQDYKKSSTYAQMWRAKDHVRDWYLGGQRASFHIIPALFEKLSQVDPDSVLDWCVAGSSATFWRAFVCPSATRNALQFCQPMVALDACHTKNRKYPSQLFLATTLDGNNKLLILAYVIAPVENKENWKWFLTNLQRAIHGIDRKDIPFISDRQKGLLPASAEVFPGKVHGHCAIHLKANVKVMHGKAISQFFWSLVYAKSEKWFKLILDRIQKHFGKGKEAVEYIRKIDPKLYSRFAFPLPRMGKVTSNPGECANSGILPIREFAPFKVLVEMWYYIMLRFKDRKRKALKHDDVLSGPARRMHESNLRTFGQWQVRDNGGKEAIVQTVDQTEEYLIQLTTPPTCTCYELQDMCWPCKHIMAWDDIDGMDFMRHFHHCWWTTSLRRLYDHELPCFVIDELEHQETCNPPDIAVKRGRHRVVRMESGVSSRRHQELVEDEYVGADGELYTRYPIQDDPSLIDPHNTIVGEIPESGEAAGGRKRKPSTVRGKGKIKCGKCGVRGHNSRTCPKNQEAELEPAQEEVAITQHAPPPSQPSRTDQFLYCSSGEDELNYQHTEAADVEVSNGGMELSSELDSEEFWHKLASQATTNDSV